MGSFYKDRNSYRYKFIDHLGKTRKLSFGTIEPSKNDQKYVDTHVMHLVMCRKTATIVNPKVQLWLAEMKGSPLSKKLAEWGLITDAGKSTLEPYLDWFFNQKSKTWKDHEGKPEWSPSTVRSNNSTKNYLVKFLGADRELHTITRGDADDFQRWLRSEETRSNRPAAITKHIKRLRGWFSYAAKKEWIKENPFDHIVCRRHIDRDRIQYMTVKQAEQVLDTLTCNQHRLFFALARFGGLRMPSEANNLKWPDVDFDESTISIEPVKVNVQGRTMPLWPEIYQLAWEEFTAWQDSDRTDDYVIHRHRTINRDGNSVVSTKIVQHVKSVYSKVGLESFHKPMQNLRTSCENDLKRILTESQLIEFMGHTTKIAQDHYRKATAEEYKMLAGYWRKTIVSDSLERTPVNHFQYGIS
ncbi:MAG: tyrosine-type recombinase/integrase [Pirellulales bacterium]